MIHSGIRVRTLQTDAKPNTTKCNADGFGNLCNQSLVSAARRSMYNIIIHTRRESIAENYLGGTFMRKRYIIKPRAILRKETTTAAIAFLKNTHTHRLYIHGNTYLYRHSHRRNIFFCRLGV